MKLFLQNNRIETYSTYNQGKSVVSERFIRALKNKIYKYMTSVSKNVYIDKLEEMVNKYNNTYHSTMTMKTFDVRSSTYSNSSKGINEKDPKFKFADIVRLSKYKNIFVKGYTLNWLEEVILIKDVKNTVPWVYVINDLNGEEIVGTDQTESQKTNQKEFRTEKLIKIKGNKLYVKWRGCNISFNSWIDGKDSINVPTNLTNLRIKVYKLHVNKSEPVPVCLSNKI